MFCPAEVPMRSTGEQIRLASEASRSALSKAKDLGKL